MSRHAAGKLLLICLSVLLTLGILELGLRAASQVDADGQITLFGRVLEPYALPVTKLHARLHVFMENQDYTTVVHHPDLGWTFRPNVARQEGTFTINGAGYRALREFELAPSPHRLRIAVFGDSFTAGDEVGDEETWAHLLEHQLELAGIRAEVYNFGVSAYGMDQAYLTWLHVAKAYQPDIVIFGLQPENLKRNVNIFRQLLSQNHAELPMSKPRFLLDEGELRLLNSPALHPEDMFDVFADFAEHPLASREYFYPSRSVAAAWWARSRLLSLLHALLAQPAEDPGIYSEFSEGGQLGKAIADAFAADVIANGAEFVALHLPLRDHLELRFSNYPPPAPPFQFLLDHAREHYRYISPEESLLKRHTEQAYWEPGGHYAPALHAIVAEVAGREITACVVSGECALPRLENRGGDLCGCSGRLGASRWGVPRAPKSNFRKIGIVGAQ